MTALTQETINDTINTLIAAGRLLAYRDDTGAIHFATADFAEKHGLTGLALTAEEAARELSAHEAELMGKWN